YWQFVRDCLTKTNFTQFMHFRVIFNLYDTYEWYLLQFFILVTRSRQLMEKYKDFLKKIFIQKCHLVGITKSIHFPCSKDHPHVIFKASASKEENCGNEETHWLPFNELHRGEFIRRVKEMNAKRVNNQPENQTEKMLKVALVLDHSMWLRLNHTENEVLLYAIQTMNVVDLYFKEIRIRTILTYVEIWNQEDRMPVSNELRKNLINFLQYKTRHLKDVDHHTAHFITAKKLEKNSVGIAVPDSVCTGSAVAISMNPSVLEPQQGSMILAHMIGHNLGMKHDEDGGCECTDQFGCIMSTKVLASAEIHSRMFSTCSYKDWDTAFNVGIAACLTDYPQPTFPQNCGNRHVERGEECDCGSEEECREIDPCCDPQTCLLKYWAQCRTGTCCHNCTYLSSDYICRSQSTECDVPEFCTGTDSECPINNYAQDGHPCGNYSGYCLGGICPTLDQQCQAIWGEEGKGADVQCFERFNPTGNFNGHCGRDNNTGFMVKCLPEDILCGLLHCDGGDKIPYYGPDKAFSKTTVFSNGMEYECKIVHGPAVLELPHMGLVQDGTKCGEGKVCLHQKCLPITKLSPLACPGTNSDVICSNHGMCTKAGTCHCFPGWDGMNCSKEMTVTRKILSLAAITMTTTTTTEEPIKVIPWNMTLSDEFTSTIATAVIEEKSSLINTKWMIIILCSVIGGLALVLLFTFVCYRRKNPKKFGKKQKKKNFFSSASEDNEFDNSSKLIKFGSLPSYKNDKLHKKKKGKRNARTNTDDESDIAELPPPPVIITDPESAKPEKGILKNAFASLKYNNERRSSESNTATSDGNDESVGQYTCDDDDTEAGEIQDILGGYDEHENRLDALDQLVESSSFDFMLPPPFWNSGLSNHSPTPPRKGFGGYELPVSSNTPARPFLWKSNLTSPPKSRALRMRNFDDLLNQLDHHTIDLSPSPDDPPLQISPSTSEDVRSSSTEDRHYQNSHDPQSPNSVTSGSTCTALRPLLGSQWSKYILHRNMENDLDGFQLGDDIESPLPHISIPPPMNPINIRSIFNYGQTTLSRENNDTPLGSQCGECGSNNGTANSRNGYEKSSGYGSEHDAERFSIDEMSRNQSRSGSASPPNFSAVIRTGPNQIKLVPASKLQSQYDLCEEADELNKLLDGLPRIDAGAYERSPLQKNVNKDYNWTTNTLEMLKRSMLNGSTDLKSSIMNESSEIESSTNTLKNSDVFDLDSGTSTLVPDSRTSTLDARKNSMPLILDGPLPNSKPLDVKAKEKNGSAPCIDRSLEEIPLAVGENGRKRKNRNSLSKLHRPTSLDVQKGEVQVVEQAEEFLNKRYSAVEKVPKPVCEC
ncbi:hypothetical protein ACJMK2_023700, partial [Sinanodonta woodiana]